MQRRPGFPARIDRPQGPAAGAAAAPLRLPRQAQPSTPQGVGLDSAAVRARMVRRLAAAGITAAPVLQAMGHVERHQPGQLVWQPGGGYNGKQR